MVTAAKVLAWVNIALCVLAVLFVVLCLGVMASVFSTVNDFEQAAQVLRRVALWCNTRC